MSYPTTRVDSSGIVHVVAYDGVKFCGPFHWTCWRETKPTTQPVTCLYCMSGWSGHLKEKTDVHL